MSPFQGSKGDPGVVGPMGPAGLPVSMGVLGILTDGARFLAGFHGLRSRGHTVFAIPAGSGAKALKLQESVRYGSNRKGSER